MTSRSLTVALAAPLALLLLAASLASAADRFVHRNPIPPRLQWNENAGYCGEVSLISAGLYYGQYVSQFDARATIGTQTGSEILVGFNDLPAARRLHLDALEWNPGRLPRPPRQFLAWTKRHVLRGWPVIIGVYNNEARLYGSSSPAAGDPTYDHIVPVVGIRSDHPLTRRRPFARDRLIFSDNGLWGTGPTRQFFFRPTFARFPGDRAAANLPAGPIYTLPDQVPNYGVAIRGILDPKRETLPVRVATSVNFESPQIRHGSNRRPPGRPLTLTITVSGLQPGRDYLLYRYDTLAAVPRADFRQNAARAAQSWPIRIAHGTTHTLRQTIDSNEIAIYRAVPADSGTAD